MICVNKKCRREHDGSFGSGLYCSKGCACSRVQTDEDKLKKSISAKLAYKPKQSKIHKYSCEVCKQPFESKKIRNGRKVRCADCKRKVSNNQISHRTWSKILKRIDAKCSLCEWNEASLDIHHIKERKNGGTNDEINLIVLCPNCHRKAHCNKIDKQILVDNNLSIRFPQWKQYYKPSKPK